MPFIAITEKAFTRLVNEQYEVLQRGIAIHRRLERLVLEERGLDEVMRALAAAIGGAVLVLSARGEPMAAKAFRRELAGRARRPAPRGGRARAAPNGTGDGSAPCVLRPRASRPGGPGAGAAGGHARQRRPAGLARGGARRGRPRRLRAPDPPAGGDRGGARADAPARDARHRAAAGGRRAGGGARRPARRRTSCRPGCARSGWATRPRCSSSGSTSGGRRAAARPLHGRRPAPGALVAMREELLCAVVDAADGRPAASSPRARARRWPRSTARCAPLPAGRRRRARCAAATTRRAARSRRRRSPTATTPEVASYRTSAPSSCCSRCRTTTRCGSTATACSGPLENGEGEYGDELMRSLEAFIEQNGQWERAARELFCHRHTLRYRIRRSRS